MSNTPEHVPPELLCPFDPIRDAAMFEDPFQRLSGFHDGPDIFWSPEACGFWVVTRADAVKEIAQNTADFSSFPAGLDAQRFPLKMIPLEVDPPEHAQYRNLVARIVAPAAIQAKTAQIKSVAQQLIEPLVARGECEFNDAVGAPMPTIIFSTMLMGLPMAESDKFLRWNHQLLHSVDQNHARAAGMEIVGYLTQLIEERRRAPGDDFVSALVQGQVDGRPLNQQELLGYTFLLFIAGLDTTTATLGYIFAYLAQHPEQQKILREHPEKIPTAVEELLRRFSPVNGNRRCTRDLEFRGVKMKAGDMVLLSTPLVNLDPKAYGCPMDVNLERRPNPHMAFSYGPHRCLGSHLARAELVAALQVWMERVPEFRLKPGTRLRHHTGVLGLDAIPLEWTPPASGKSS